METELTSEERLAVVLQRAKTHMETSGISARYSGVYKVLSRTIYEFEDLANVDAPRLRDEQDGR